MTQHEGCGFEGCCGRRTRSARLIDARMPELARSLTLFRYVQAVTGGPAARIDQAGGYAVPSLRDEAFTVHPDAITLRLDPTGIDTAALERDTATDATVLHLRDREGRTTHQGRLLSDGDRLLAGLLGTAETGRQGAGPVTAPAPWEDGDQLAQLDAILGDGGLARRGAFGRYRGAHRSVDVGVLPAVLDHVCSVGLPVGVAVFAPGALQACAGRVHVTDRTVGGRMFAAIAHASVEIDLTAVHTCRLVRSTAAHGPTSSLELDDERGRCVALITQFGIVGEDVHTAWEDLTASLPNA